jgi:hypothetical protein
MGLAVHGASCHKRVVMGRVGMGRVVQESILGLCGELAEHIAMVSGEWAAAGRT